MILYTAAAVLALFVLYDVVITVMSTQGAGPLTRRWTRVVWRLLLVVHRKWPIHRFLSLVGPLLMLLSILIWYLLLASCVSLVFLESALSVVHSSNQVPAEPLERFYFVAATLSTIGYGDIVPAGFPWTLVATASTLIVTIVMTVSLSYVLAVISAALERRQLAQGVMGLGSNVAEVLRETELASGDGTLDDHLRELARDLDMQSLRRLAYPVLEFFHSPELKDAPSRAVLLLSDAVFVMRHKLRGSRPPEGILRLVERSIDNYIERALSNVMELNAEDPHPEDLLEALKQEPSIDTNDPEFEASLNEYLQNRRRHLCNVCREDGWDAT
ncbi:MAG: potassium channel family protein [Fimbriimonadaceae bacterium]